MKRYAFVDVENTATTTEQMLGFVVDWMKVSEFLRHDKSCTKIYFYTAIESGDQSKATEFETLNNAPCNIVRSKQKMLYKRKDKLVSFPCTCGVTTAKNIDMGYNVKGNCDVELTVDALEKAEAGNEYYIFSGDGDFEFLALRLIEKNVKVTFVSHGKVIIRSGIRHGRYSSKLRKLVADNPKWLNFQEIDNWKKKFEKVVT